MPKFRRVLGPGFERAPQLLLLLLADCAEHGLLPQFVALACTHTHVKRSARAYGDQRDEIVSLAAPGAYFKPWMPGVWRHVTGMHCCKRFQAVSCKAAAQTGFRPPWLDV